METVDAIVLGAGAAGLMCAIEVGKRGKQVIILERNSEPGRKILISGGGRCNFTNIHCEAANFLSDNPHFAKSALARSTPSDFISLVEKYRVPYHEKKLGQLFCDDSAKRIVELLLAECRAAGVKIILDCAVSTIRRPGQFIVETGKGEYQSPVLVVATGGLSIPKIGATALGYEIAKQFGIAVRPCRPALVPLTFSQADKTTWCDLAGLAADVVASVKKVAFRERLLITHRGLSGPAILQLSSYWTKSDTISINLAPDGEPILPRRFLNRWQEQQDPAQPPYLWLVHPSGTEGYEKAEVTAGGVDTDELSSKTMESKSVPGLYFIGELVDVTGHLGGFNFQWAWSSGAAAGRSL